MLGHCRFLFLLQFSKSLCVVQSVLKETALKQKTSASGQLKITLPEEAHYMERYIGTVSNGI